MNRSTFLDVSAAYADVVEMLCNIQSDLGNVVVDSAGMAVYNDLTSTVKADIVKLRRKIKEAERMHHNLEYLRNAQANHAS